MILCEHVFKKPYSQTVRDSETMFTTVCVSCFTCPVLRVTCKVSHFTFQKLPIVRARDLNILHICHHPLAVMCYVACVMCHVSHVSCVMCHMSFVTFTGFFYTVVEFSRLRVCYQRGLSHLVFMLMECQKSNIFFYIY